MALMSGGDWSPYADVAHQLVGEGQQATALQLQAWGQDDRRKEAQAHAKMQQLGFDEKVRQFDLGYDLSERELAQQQFEAQVRADATAEKVKQQQMEKHLAGMSTRAREAITLGFDIDPTTKESCPITKDHPMYPLRQEFLKNRKKTGAAEASMMRRLSQVQSSIRGKAALNQKREQDLLVAEAQGDEATVERLTKEIAATAAEIRGEQVVYDKLFQECHNVTKPKNTILSNLSGVRDLLGKLDKGLLGQMFPGAYRVAGDTHPVEPSDLAREVATMAPQAPAQSQETPQILQGNWQEMKAPAGMGGGTWKQYSAKGVTVVGKASVPEKVFEEEAEAFSDPNVDSPKHIINSRPHLVYKGNNFRIRARYWGDVVKAAREIIDQINRIMENKKLSPADKDRMLSNLESKRKGFLFKNIHMFYSANDIRPAQPFERPGVDPAGVYNP